MHNVVVGKDYEFVDTNLLELRKKFLTQENLTNFDIVKGYHDLVKCTRVQYDISSFAATDEEKEILKSKVEEVWDKTFEKVDVVCEETLRKFYEDWAKESPETIGCFSFEDFCDKVNKLVTVNRNICNARAKTRGEYSDITGILVENIVSWMNCISRFDSIPSVIAHNFNKLFKENLLKSDFGKFYLKEMKFDNVTLPDGLNLIEFLEKKEFDDVYVKSCEIVIEKNVTHSYLGKYSFNNKLLFDAGMHYLTGGLTFAVKMDADKVEDFACNAILSSINAANYTKYSYYQELENSPITINMAGEKIQLIDGFKRLLYVSDENLLNVNVPVKVYKDLDDKSYFAILYACNYWKAKVKQAISFHDRGFLLSLSQRFGNFKRICGETSIIDFLSTYDGLPNGNENFFTTKDRFACDEKFLFGHAYLVSDLRNIYEHIDEYYGIKTSYNSIMDDYIKKELLVMFGKVRHLYDIAQIENVTVDMLGNIINSSTLKPLLSKKNYSSDTYCERFFRENNVFRIIKDELLAMVTITSKEKEV